MAIDGPLPGHVAQLRFRYSDVQRVSLEAAPAHRDITIYELGPADMSEVVVQITSGQLDIIDSMDLAVSPPVLEFYDGVTPAGE